MPSAIQIYNHGLSRIGVSDFIGDPAEQSKAGDFYRLWYATCVEMVLRDFPWNFASSVAALALVDGDPPPGWSYKYAYPLDCHAAHLLSDSCGVRNLAGFAYAHWDFYGIGQANGLTLARPPVPFQVMSEAATSTTRRRIIVTDLPQAYLFYTAKVTDPNQFDPGFCDALSWRIAMEIAAPFLGAPTGPQVATNAKQQYLATLVRAKAQTLNESTEDPRADSIAIQARA
jgi:hypothetical protein